MKMKLNYLFILLPILIGFQAHAQDQNNRDPFNEEADKIFSGGLILGLNVCQIDGDTYAGYHKAGLNVGATVLWRFSKPVALGVELLYSQKGSRAVQDIYTPSGTGFEKYKIDLNYAELPLIFYYILSPKYQIGIGGSFNGLISSKEDIPSSYYHQTVNQEDYPFNKSSVDFIGGASVKVFDGLTLTGRYQYGLTPVRNANNLPGIGSGNQFNNMFSFRLTYYF